MKVTNYNNRRKSYIKQIGTKLKFLFHNKIVVPHLINLPRVFLYALYGRTLNFNDAQLLLCVLNNVAEIKCDALRKGQFRMYYNKIRYK